MERVFALRIAVSNRGAELQIAVLSDFGAEHSFAKAAQQCKEHYGFRYPSQRSTDGDFETGRTGALKVGSPIQGSISPAASPRQRACGGRSQGHDLHGGTRKTKSQTSALLARNAPGRRPGHGSSRQSHYAASFGKVQEVGRRWAHCAKSAGRGTRQPDPCGRRLRGMDPPPKSRRSSAINKISCATSPMPSEYSADASKLPGRVARAVAQYRAKAAQKRGCSKGHPRVG